MFNILVVDDDKHTRRLFKAVLESENYTVFTASNGLEALDFDEHNISANEELLKQVWINLIDNAVKFSPEYGLVVIKITESDGIYRISVSNFGDEIPEESRQKIFSKFYQADESHSSEGNGIGLAIVKKVIEPVFFIKKSGSLGSV